MTTKEIFAIRDRALKKRCPKLMEDACRAAVKFEDQFLPFCIDLVKLREEARRDLIKGTVI